MGTSLGKLIGELKLYQLLLVVVLLGSILYREYTWHSETTSLKSAIESLQRDVDSLTMMLQLGKSECDLLVAAPTGDGQDMALREKYAQILGATVNTDAIKNRLLKFDRAAIFNMNGIFAIAVCASIMLVEIYSVHRGTVFPSDSGEGESADEQQPWVMGNRYFESYIARRKIFSNAVIHSSVLLLSTLAWFGVFTWSNFVPLLFKFVILWATAGHFAYWVHNIIRIRRYLPKTFNEARVSATHASWWMWVLSRVFTSEAYMYADATRNDDGSLTAMLSVLVSLVKDAFTLWPYRYFYYYCDSCSPAPAVGLRTDSLSGIASAAASAVAAVDTTGIERSRDLFLLNMLIQSSIAVALFYTVTVLAMGSPKWYKQLFRGVFRREYDWFTSLVMLAMGVNGVVVILRVLWFFFTCKCTWYASLMCFMFISQHVVMFFEIMPVASASMERSEVRNQQIESFVEEFLESHVHHYKEYYKDAGLDEVIQRVADARSKASTDPDAGLTESEQAELLKSIDILKDIGVLGVEAFETLLDKTSRNYITGYGKYTYITSIDSDHDKEEISMEDDGQSGKKKKVSHYAKAFNLVCLYTFTAPSGSSSSGSSSTGSSAGEGEDNEEASDAADANSNKDSDAGVGAKTKSNTAANAASSSSGNSGGKDEKEEIGSSRQKKGGVTFAADATTASTTTNAAAGSDTDGTAGTDQDKDTDSKSDADVIADAVREALADFDLNMEEILKENNKAETETEKTKEEGEKETELHAQNECKDDEGDDSQVKPESEAENKKADDAKATDDTGAPKSADADEISPVMETKLMLERVLGAVV